MWNALQGKVAVAVVVVVASQRSFTATVTSFRDSKRDSKRVSAPDAGRTYTATFAPIKTGFVRRG